MCVKLSVFIYFFKVFTSISQITWNKLFFCVDQKQKIVQMVQYFQVSTSCSWKKINQLLQEMTQHTAAKYDNCSSEVIDLPSLELNIKD